MKWFCRQFVVVFAMIILLLPCQVAAKSQPFAELNVELDQNEVSLLLRGELAFSFSKAALEALANGLPLAVNTEVVIKPASKWYWQKSLISHSYKLEIQYHALSQQYLVKSFISDYPRVFLTQLAALGALGRVDELLLIDLALLDPDEQYEISIRATLDSESLPVPLRPLIYLSSEWRMRSDWKRLHWPLKN